MGSLNLRLPESLHDQLRELAQRDRVSINQFVVLAVAEKIAALRTLDYIEQRGRRGSREKLDRVLQKVTEAGREPYEADHLPGEAGSSLVLAGYAAANAVVEKERAERLAHLTLEQALEMARDLEASWERQPAPRGVQRRQR